MNPRTFIAGRYAGFEARMFAPVDGAALAVFRIAFGGLILWDVAKYLIHDLIRIKFLIPHIHFKYYGFEWVEVWPGDGMYYHFAALGLFAILVMLGLFYRVAIVLLTVAFSYVFLLDQTDYLNHFYFVILLGFLLCITPAHRVWSLDATLWPERTTYRSATAVPGWSVWVFRAQMEVVLLYAGIVKINPDWLQLQPLRMWLGARADMPIVGPLLLQDWAIAVASYGSIALHVLGAPLLLFERTRIWAFAAYCVFHLSNHVLFNIGIFPWLTIAGTTIFFAADWPRQVITRIRLVFYRGRSRAGVGAPGE